LKLFLDKYSWNILEKSSKKYFELKKSYYFVKVHVKNLAENVIFKKIEIHYCLKANVTMLNE
jgi:hypothetical protein